MLVYFFPNNGNHEWRCGYASPHHWSELGCIYFENVLLLTHPSVRFGVWVIFLWILRFRHNVWYWPHHHHRLQPSAAHNPPLPSPVSHLLRWLSMIIHISKSMGPPMLWPSFLPIKSMRDQQHKRWNDLTNMINSSKKTFNFFFLLWFPTSCFGSSSHDHNALHSWWKFVHIKIPSAHNFDWYPTRQQLCSVCFWQFFFYLKLASLSCLLSGALNAKICFMVSVSAHLYPLG